MAVVLHGESSDIAWRAGDMYLPFQLERKRTVFSKVDANVYCSILKVS